MLKIDLAGRGLSEAIDGGLEGFPFKNRLWDMSGSARTRSNFEHLLASLCPWGSVVLTGDGATVVMI